MFFWVFALLLLHQEDPKNSIWFAIKSPSSLIFSQITNNSLYIDRSRFRVLLSFPNFNRNHWTPILHPQQMIKSSGRHKRDGTQCWPPQPSRWILNKTYSSCLRSFLHTFIMVSIGLRPNHVHDRSLPYRYYRWCCGPFARLATSRNERYKSA